MPEYLVSDDEYYAAIQASRSIEEARDRAYKWRAEAGNPISRMVSDALANHMDRRFYDSEEHVGMIEEIRRFDETHRQSTD